MTRLAATLLALVLLAAPGAADARTSPDRTLLDQVNVLRAQHDLEALRPSRALARSSRRWARRTARAKHPRHANLREEAGRWRSLAELLQWQQGRTDPEAAFSAWTASAPHLELLLDPQLEWFGSGRARSKIDAKSGTIWVVRLAAD